MIIEINLKLCRYLYSDAKLQKIAKNNVLFSYFFLYPIRRHTSKVNFAKYVILWFLNTRCKYNNLFYWKINIFVFNFNYSSFLDYNNSVPSNCVILALFICPPFMCLASLLILVVFLEFSVNGITITILAVAMIIAIMMMFFSTAWKLSKYGVFHFHIFPHLGIFL